MKLAYGLSALLLGTTLLTGGASAQNNANPAPPPPNGPVGAPDRSHFAGHPNFAGPRPGSNQARWNHVVTYHDRNVAHFSTQDHAMWASGQWRHAKHNGRNGWWWYTNGAWFYYDEPTYPYPDYVSDDYAFDDDAYDTAAPYQGGYLWYYCNNPPGYYPYVPSCRGPWQPVTPTPPDGYDQGPQGAPDDYQNDDQGPPPGQPPRDNYQGQPYNPQQGYDNGGRGDDDQGPPPPGYDGYQGQPQGYGPPPGYGDQPPPR